MIVLAYLIAGLLALIALSLAGSPSATVRNHRMNTTVVVQAVIFLGITLYSLIASDFPVFYRFSHYFFIDSLGIYEIFITSIVFLLGAIYARGYLDSLLAHGEIDSRMLKLFYGAFGLLQTVITFCFLSNNLALFWIFLELTTVLSAILIVTLRIQENITAALKYLFVASTAMLFSIIGLILLYALSAHSGGEGTLNLDELMRQTADFSPSLFMLAFVFIFIGFAAKAGIVPFHTWLPPAHGKAPSVVSALLSAALLNVGIYGIMRVFALGHSTPAWNNISVLLLVFGILSIAVAAFCMLPRTNIKKLIAFSSIEHMGLILIGLGLGTKVALFWVLFHQLGHALIKSQLFFSTGILGQQYGSNYIDRFRNAIKIQPLAVWGIILGGAAIIGMPLFPVFLSKLFILLQLGDRSLWLLALVLALLLLAAAAFAVFMVRAFTTDSQDQDSDITPYHVPWSMKAPIMILILLTLVAGLYPGALREMIDKAVACLGF